MSPAQHAAIIFLCYPTDFIIAIPRSENHKYISYPRQQLPNYTMLHYMFAAQQSSNIIMLFKATVVTGLASGHYDNGDGICMIIFRA
jgi:phenolic acid decarboxylase